MGATMHVDGIREPDDRWREMKTVYDSCVAAGVPVPSQVRDFFDHEPPDPAGIRVDLSSGKEPITREWNTDTQQGFELSVEDLPANITKLRFYLLY